VVIANETELYKPVKDYFETLGYEVKSEVNRCDLVAIKYNEHGSTPIIVELKKSFNLQLIFQSLDRLRLTDQVYAAVEYHPNKKLSSYFTWQDATNLCKRLGIGLIGVQFYKKKSPAVDILCLPGDRHQARKSHVGAKRLLNEFERRSGDYNIGGSSKRKLVTAYREKALRIAALMSAQESMSPKELRALLHDPTVGLVLRDNHYGWYERIKIGHYRLTSSGHKALIEYAYLL
jgi:hypothetical protein